jgi:acetyl-CoA acetyltransferase
MSLRTPVIAGIGATEFSKDSGRSELQLAAEATVAAIADAGLRPADVDGMVTFHKDTSPEIDVAKTIGAGALTMFSRIPHGGGAACGTVMHAAMAIATGAADVVVAYRAFNERSAFRYGTGYVVPQGPTAEPVHYGWYLPYGMSTPAQQIAMVARRYMHTYGATSADFGQVSVAMRRHASTNPKAWFYERPITIEEHQQSRWIADPLRLLDCCQESDGGVAIVLTTAERARESGAASVGITAAAQGTGIDDSSMTAYYRGDLTTLPSMATVAAQLWRRSGLAPADIDVAILYDHFTPFVLMQLEELGFCERGEARHFVADGGIELDGHLPVNPNGGQLGEAYIHGMNGIAEAVRQVRGTSVNQIADVQHVLVTAGTGVPTSGLVLSRDS